MSTTKTNDNDYMLDAVRYITARIVKSVFGYKPIDVKIDYIEPEKMIDISITYVVPPVWTFAPIEIFLPVGPKCECGAESIGVHAHSHWCQKEVK